jgi:hypothetical protein
LLRLLPQQIATICTLLLALNLAKIEDINLMIRDLDRGGVNNLIYTTTHDSQTGEISYIDRNGNLVS